MKYHTAPTYTNYEKLSEPFQKGDKWYITVRLKNGSAKDVRAYPDEEVAAAGLWNARRGLGFGDAGYITIFAGEISMDDEYFSRSVARYCVRWGWYIVSDDVVPDDIPYYATPKKLLWSSVGNADNTLKSTTEVNAAVNSLIFGAKESITLGSIGERLDLVVTVVKTSASETKYGTNTTHTFKDSDGNLLKWATSAKSWAEGTTHHIRGTVKEYHNNITILTRCVEI